MLDNIVYLGIRHHGPGSAASIKLALEEYKPDLILLEGAIEAQDLLSFITDPNLIPPVAQLIYAPGDHNLSVFYPFTQFSPEWQASLYAKQTGTTITLFDLPQKHWLALREDSELEDNIREFDPLDRLAKITGFADGEKWWESVVEEHPSPIELFSHISDVMRELRFSINEDTTESKITLLREAWMRKSIRQAHKDGFKKIAVVCGAWHVPALQQKITIKDDNELLKGLPSIKVTATWIPWTYSRIASQSGYGAGIESPGWYEHIWEHWQNDDKSDLATKWLAKVAQFLRKEGIDVPPASVIDAVRLTNTLATLRLKNAPNLVEITDAIKAIFNNGDSSLLTLIHKKMVIGEKLGKVPDNIPKTPLQEDFIALLKKLKLKLSAVDEIKTLDLRKEIDLERSALFHCLNILDTNWATKQQVNTKGTFKEAWCLKWTPQLELALIEKAIWGNTISIAVNNYVLSKLPDADLKLIIEFLNSLLKCGLDETCVIVINHLQEKSAITHHINVLMDALPALVEILRYGDVRNTDVTVLEKLITQFLERICIGLVNECMQLDLDGASLLAKSITNVDSSIQILNNEELSKIWYKTLSKIINYDFQGIIIGRSYRILVNSGFLSKEEMENALSQALSKSLDPMQIATWLEGLLLDFGAMLLHDDKVWSLLNNYIMQLTEERFIEMAPLLRRTFSSFALGERNGILSKSLSNQEIVEDNLDDNFDILNANSSLALLYKIIGGV